jgi:hypothetical protein
MDQSGKELPIKFDVLIRSESSGKLPSLATVEKFHAPAEAVEKCRRWFAGRGVNCHATPFGLACNAPPQIFASIFEVEVTPVDPGTSKSGHKTQGTIHIPYEIADLVDQITITVEPEFF